MGAVKDSDRRGKTETCTDESQAGRLLSCYPQLQVFFLVYNQSQSQSEALFIESKKRWPAVETKLDFLWPECNY